MEVKQALKDPRFRDVLPLELKEDVVKYLTNPGCACNVPFYRKLIKEYPQFLIKYYPGLEVMNEADETKILAENHWMVINCRIDELESKLKSLPPGRKMLAVARYENQVTVVVNELDILI
jgi:hypothetical protein